MTVRYKAAVELQIYEGQLMARFGNSLLALSLKIKGFKHPDFTPLIGKKERRGRLDDYHSLFVAEGN
jgi:hypothetical protein